LPILVMYIQMRLLALASSLCCAATVRLEGEALESDLQRGVVAADEELQWVYGSYGAASCNESERREFHDRFGAWPADDLNADLWTEPRPPGKLKEQVVLMYPLRDPNGAFSINDQMCYRLLSFARLYESVTLVHFSSVPEAYDFLSAVDAGSVRHLVVGGHGTPTSLGFGPCDTTLCKLKAYTPSAHDFWVHARSRLNRKGRIFLDSCLNGKFTEDGHNNARYVSSLLPGVRIYSSQISFGSHNYVVRDFENFDLMVRDVGDNLTVKNFVFVGNCKTAPEHWHDVDGRDCETFANKGLCLMFGNSTSSEGIQAKDACCQCGGGATGETTEQCPHFAEPVGSSGGKRLCKCRDPTSICYQDGHRGCELGDGHIFEASHGSHVECRTSYGAGACPVRGHATGYFLGECRCSHDHVCHFGSSLHPGCPGHDGTTKLKSFPADCEECHCQPLRRKEIHCHDGLCTCPSHLECYVGSRKGCPIDADYPKKLAQGPIGSSTTTFAESCLFCSCHAQCSGGFKDAALHSVGISEPDGRCACSDEAICIHGEAKSKQVQQSWGVLKPVNIEAMHPGDCPTPGLVDVLVDHYYDIYKCPDCFCAYNGLKAGAPTSTGSTCQVGWKTATGKQCNRPDGCCYIPKEANREMQGGPWCPTVNASSGLMPFESNAPVTRGFKVDRCTAIDPPPTAVWRSTGEAAACMNKKGKVCGHGELKSVYGCFDAETREAVPESVCAEFRQQPEEGTESCVSCRDCAELIPYIDNLCFDVCKDETDCDQLMCAGCGMCEELRKVCAS